MPCSNERLWRRAKRRVREQYPDVSEDSDRYWRLVQGIYQTMTGRKAVGRSATAQETLAAIVREVAALPVPDPDLYTEYDVPESVLQGGDPPPYVALPEEMTPEQREDPQPPGLIPPELRQMLTSPPYVSEEGDEGFLRDIARHNREDRHIQNKYPGNCVYCGKRVAPGGGYVTPVHTSGGWATLHQGARGNWATECDECRASERIVDLAVTREAAEPVAAPRETAEPVAAPRVDVYGCRRLSARYPGTCRACGQKIRGGDDIYWHPDQEWCVHSKCAGAGITKGLRRLVFGVRRFPLVLPARIVKGTMPWVRFRGGRRTVHSLQKAAGTSEGTVPPPSRGGKYTREEIESLGLRWVTAHPGGYEREGVPILVRDLGDEYIVVGGAGHSMDMMRLPKRKAGEAPKAPKSRKELPPEVQEELETKLQQHKEAVQAARQEVRERVRTVLEEAGISEEVPKDLLDLVAERARKKAEEEGDVEHAEELAEKAQKAAEREHRERVKRAVDATIDTAMQQLAEAELTGEPQVGEVEVEAVEAEGDELVKRLRRVRLDQDTATEIAQQVFALKDTERAQRAVARALRQGRPARAELAETLLTPLSDEEVRKRALADQVDAERVRLNNALIDMAVGGKREKLSDRGLIDGAGDAVYAVCSELTDSIPFTQHQLQRIGTRAGARLIARHLERQGVDREAAARAIHNYISEHGDAVVAEAVAQGQHLLDTADRAVACAVEGGMSSKAFAYGRALHYRKAARDLANRAVGSMAMMAQVAAELEAPSTEEFILPGQETHTGTVMLARRLGLTDDQYTITKRRGGYQIHVSPEGEDLLMRPRSLQSYGEDQAITEIRKRRAGEGWTRRGPDGEERPWKPEGMTETLRDGTHWDLAPHQQADAMMVERQHGVLIADEAGTGKTFAALAAVAHLASQGKARRVIIVVPKNTVTQWYEATQDLLAPELASAVQIASGDTPRRQRMSTLAAEGVDAEQMHIVITNHDTIRNHAGDIDDGNYDMIVLDEAHQFTERAGRESAQRAQALRELSMEYRMLLTGTPVKNDLSEFHSLVDYIQPGLLGDREEFLARYGKLSGPATAGYEALMRDLQNAVRGCMLGTRLSRPAGEGVFELRPLGTGQQPIMMREEYVSVAPSSEQREELRQVSATYEGLSDVPGATFARRAQEQKVINDLDPESNAKMAATREILSRHPDERVLIFATYRYAIDTVRDALGLDEQEIRVIDGSMSDKQRYAVQQELNDPASPVRVVLCTDAANTGQNLQAATVVVNVDLPDTPSIVRQRFARAWRVRPPKGTQDWPDLPDTVHVYHLQSETQYDIEQRHRLEQKTRQMDMPHKLDQADDTEGLGGILSAYLRERDAHGQAATA